MSTIRTPVVMASASRWKYVSISRARKGILAPGSDGDIVVYDPGDSHVIRGEDCISKAGYTPYEGFVTAGGIRSVWLRGRKVVEHGTVLEDAPTGMYLSRGKYSL